MRRSDDAHRGRAAVLLVVGMQDEQKIHRFGESWINCMVVAEPEHHVQEIL